MSTVYTSLHKKERHPSTHKYTLSKHLSFWQLSWDASKLFTLWSFRPCLIQWLMWARYQIVWSYSTVLGSFFQVLLLPWRNILIQNITAISWWELDHDYKKKNNLKKNSTKTWLWRFKSHQLTNNLIPFRVQMKYKLLT